jgi:hypothetical protein
LKKMDNQVLLFGEVQFIEGGEPSCPRVFCITVLVSKAISI